jgi:hypothetical protein
MRCKTCNENLTTSESTTVDTHTGDFLDLCHVCVGVTNKSLSEFEWANDVEIDYKED